MSAHSTASGVLVPTDNISRALLASAVPGFSGQVRIEFSIQPEAVNDISLIVIRNEVNRSTSGNTREHVPAKGDSERDRLVNTLVDFLKARLRLKTSLVAVVGHFQDGRLLRYDFEDEVNMAPAQ